VRTIAELARERVERVIIQNEMLRAGFAAFPYQVMRDRGLSGGARLAYAFLLMYAWQEGSCFASQQTMAREMGVSERQLQRYLYELRDQAYIQIERRDRRFNNTYIILERKPTKLKAGKAG
jgi:AraC-like DNA-binding protein